MNQKTLICLVDDFTNSKELLNQAINYATKNKMNQLFILVDLSLYPLLDSLDNLPKTNIDYTVLVCKEDEMALSYNDIMEAKSYRNDITIITGEYIYYVDNRFDVNLFNGFINKDAFDLRENDENFEFHIIIYKDEQFKMDAYINEMRLTLSTHDFNLMYIMDQKETLNFYQLDLVTHKKDLLFKVK